MSREVATFSYPDTMLPALRKMNAKMWSAGGEFNSYADALKEAEKLAEERNHPIQIRWLGSVNIVYPKSMGYHIPPARIV